MLNKNPDWLLAQNSLDIVAQIEKEIGAARLPLVRLNGAYNYNYSQSQAGFSLYNQGMGPQVGLSLSVPLFTGNVNKVNVANAKLNVQSAELRKTQVQQNLKAALSQAWLDYEVALQQCQTDSVAVKMADDYAALMDLRFTNGQNTIIELIESQKMYLETYYRYINAQYVLKLAETQLMVLSGQLVKF
jgi:outer membrane protein TolC